MPDQSLQNDPTADQPKSAHQQTGNPAEVAGNTPSEAKDSALAANVTEASEGEKQQADVTINRDPNVGDQPAEGSGPRTSEASDNYDDEEAWPYRKLQAEAKERTGSGGGTRDEIVARLRESGTGGSGGGVDLGGGSADNLGAPTSDADPSPEVQRGTVDSAQVENGGIQKTDFGQQHAEVLQGLSAERRAQQLEAVKQGQQQA